MKKTLLVGALLGLLSCPAHAAPADIASQAAPSLHWHLQEVMEAAVSTDTLQAYVVLEERLNLEALLLELEVRGATLSERHYEVVTRIAPHIKRLVVG